MSRAILMMVALMAAGAATQVEAAHRHYHYGHNHGGSRYGTGFRSQSYGYYGRPWRQGSYHNTGHYDYHRTTVVPHRNHYHVVPGHYHWHNTGHWHY